MEHSLHLAAHHFITALNKKLTTGVSSIDDHDLPALPMDEVSADEEDEDVFAPGDVLGKTLVFVRAVRIPRC